MSDSTLNKVGLWTGTAEDGRTVAVTSLEVQAVRLFARDAAAKVGAQEGFSPLAVAKFLHGVSATSDDSIARCLMVAKSEAAKDGVPLINLTINGDQVDLVPPEGQS